MKIAESQLEKIITESVLSAINAMSMKSDNGQLNEDITEDAAQDALSQQQTKQQSSKSETANKVKAAVRAAGKTAQKVVNKAKQAVMDIKDSNEKASEGKKTQARDLAKLSDKF